MASFPESTKEWARHMREHIGYAIYLESHRKDLERALAAVPKGKKGGNDIVLPGLEELVRYGGIQRPPETVFDDKKRVAAEIYEQFGYSYGFGQCLVTGDWAPLPDTITQAPCATQALVNLVLTEACSMESVLVEFRDVEDPFQRFPSHAFTVTDVGDETPWVIDQPRRMYGPVSFKGNTVEVVNKANGDKVRTFTFGSAETYDEERYAERLAYQRSEAGAASMILDGQKIKPVKVDQWKATEPLFADLFIRYNHTRLGIPRSVSVMAQFDRPLILKRGIEYRIAFDEDGRVFEESVIGHLCRSHEWAEFAGNIPVVTIPSDQVPHLLEGMYGLSVEEQIEFEDGLMRLFINPASSSKYGRYREAIQASYNALKDTQWRLAVRKIALAEALYQERKKGAYIYEERERRKALESSPVTEDVAEILSARRGLERLRRREPRMRARAMEGRTRLQGPQPIYILHRECRDDREVREFQSLETALDRLTYIDKHKPLFLEESADRALFAQRELRDHLGSLDALEAHARTVLRDCMESAILGGYARLFAEMLGHTRDCWDYINLPPRIRADVIRKVSAYRP